MKPSVRRTWSLRGQTPILRHRCSWKRVHAIANIACLPDGSYRLLLYWQEQAINEHAILDHLERLRQEIGGPVVLLWDGLPSHRSKLVKEYLAANRDWLFVVRFPAYAPELNPVEYFNSAVKGKDLPNYVADIPLEIEQQLCLARDRIQGDQHLIKGFLRASGLY
jgi:transposase